MKILGISGRKQSGKNTTANILHGTVLKELGNIADWSIGSNGELMVETDQGWGEFDITRKDHAFAEYAEYNMWPYVKLYSFADELKRICVELFCIPHECVYGTDEQKNKPQEHLLWENICDDRDGPMTSREFMQFFGTDICRRMYEPIWVNSCIRKIQEEQSGLAIVADVRFPNEAKAIEEANGTLVRLTRQVIEDNHSSEVALDDYPFTSHIDNKDNSIDSLLVKVKKFYKTLKE